MDTVVTGNPLYSLSSTAGLAQELERTQGLSSVIASVWTYGVRIDKLPVVLGALIGLPLAIWLAPRRVADAAGRVGRCWCACSSPRERSARR